MSDLFFDNIDNSVTAQVAADFLSSNQKVQELNSQISWVVTQRKVEYLDQLLLLSSHKSVSVRRNLAKAVGFLATNQDIDKILAWQLAEADREAWLILESAVDKIQRSKLSDNIQKSAKVLTVTEALGQIKKIVDEKQFTIEGEVVEVRALGQMYYFGLKDGQDSRIDVRAFSGVIVRAGFPLNEGLSVRVKGRFKIGQKQARLYFDVESLELTGEGELLRNLQLLKEKLGREGLLDEDRKRRIPKLPKSILLIASQNGAAVTDYLKTLESRRGGLNIYFLAVKTQGVGAESDVLEKLSLANEYISELNIDLVVLTRGGGSSEDLIVFNSEKVARAVHGLSAPSIVAIGHERDVTLAELVADLRASTPTRAAELSSASWLEINQEIQILESYYQKYTSTRIAQYRHFTLSVISVSQALVVHTIHENRSVARRIDFIVNGFISKVRLQSDQVSQQVKQFIQNNLQTLKFQVQLLQNPVELVQVQLSQYKTVSLSSYTNILDKIVKELEQTRNKFELISSQILLQDPKNILQKGYAIVYKNGKVQSDLVNVAVGDKVSLEMIDGKIELEMKKRL